ncbi:hypothetical protein TomTYG45_06040 [Sphingobium sp. TomTYG45]
MGQSQMELKSRENRLRARLKALDYRLQKTPARSQLREHYGAGYMVVDYRNTVMLGACQRAYDATVDDVEEFADNLTS